VTIYYPLHPFFGREDLPVVRRFGSGRAEQLEVDTGQRRQLVAAWMTCHDRCERMSISSEPRCSLPALWELIALLQASDL
jgi:hypothetical protein